MKRSLRSMAVILTLGLVTLSSPSSMAAEECSGSFVRCSVPTFHSIGLYWKPAGAGPDARVRYRVRGTSGWKNGHDLWYAGNGEYRGSLVNLRPATSYEIELSIAGGASDTFVETTWSEVFPIRETRYLPEFSTDTLTIEQGGNASGYVLYTHAPGKSAVIDGQNQNSNNIVIKASYVIIRGLTLRGSQDHAIVFKSDATDVVIEENDISRWGTRDGIFATPYIGGIRANRIQGVKRVVIQRNWIHDPNYDANSWCESRSTGESSSCSSNHPYGAGPIRLSDTGGNHVIRYNSLTSNYPAGDPNYYYDMIGGQAGGDHTKNLDDSDIYGNFLERSWDNPIEAEGAGVNTRIWGNFIDHSYAAIGVNPVGDGPTYIFRNVINAAKKGPFPGSDNQSSKFIKAHGSSGKIYVYHNTLLQPGGGLHGVTKGIDAGSNLTSRNNILHVWEEAETVSIKGSASSNDFDYDLCNGSVPSGVESRLRDRGLYPKTPRYDSGNKPREYFLDPASPGFDAGERLQGFNDDFTGSGPDIGAYERGRPPLEFGVDAYRPDSGTSPPDPPRGVRVE